MLQLVSVLVTQKNALDHIFLLFSQNQHLSVGYLRHGLPSNFALHGATMQRREVGLPWKPVGCIITQGS